MSEKFSTGVRPDDGAIVPQLGQIATHLLEQDFHKVLGLVLASLDLSRDEALDRLDALDLSEALAKRVYERFSGVIPAHEVRRLARHHVSRNMQIQNRLVPEFGEEVGKRIPQAKRNPVVAYRTVVLLSHLLPARDNKRYSEQWRCELYELREEGARWYRRAGAVLQFARAAFSLAVTLRLGRSRVIE